MILGYLINEFDTNAIPGLKLLGVFTTIWMGGYLFTVNDE